MKPQIVVGLVVAAAIAIMIIVLVAVSLKKLASDQGKAELICYDYHKILKFGTDRSDHAV